VHGLNAPIASADNPGDEAIVFADIPPRDATPTFHHKARHGFYEDRLLPSEPQSLIRNRY